MKLTGLHQAFAVGPIFLCGGLALYSRAYKDPFEVQCGTKEQDEVVLRYAPYVREEHLLLSCPKGKLERKQVLSLARRWDDAVRQGDLQPIRPVSFEDDPANGVRGNIFRCKSALVSYLMDDAERQSKTHRECEAAEEVLIAFRLTESLKYGDLESVGVTAVEENQELAFFSAHAHLICDRSQRQVRDAMQGLLAKNDSLAVLTEQSTNQFYDFQRRFRGHLGASEIRETAMLGQRIRSEGKDPHTLRMVRKNYLGDNDDAGLQYLCSLRFAWRMELETKKKARTLLERLSNVPTV